MKCKISKEAEKDLEKIWLYTFETWSLEQADYYYSNNQRDNLRNSLFYKENKI